MGKRKGGRRGAHPTYKSMSSAKAKNRGVWRPGKKPGSKFTARGNRIATHNWKS